MERVGSQTGAWWLQDVLRQNGAQYPRAKLDEIADSIMMRAMTPALVQQQGEDEHAVDAILALAVAGSRGPWKGVPYHGAFERLIAVHQRAPVLGVRRRALSGMLASPNHSRAVDYLRGVAESNDTTAFDAIGYLIGDANGGSNAGGVQPTASQQRVSAVALKALVSRGRVRNRRAADVLDAWWVMQPEAIRAQRGVKRM
jgi:hypothetical protein